MKYWGKSQLVILGRYTMDVGAVDFERFPRDLVFSKFRILGCKIEGVTF